jgi:CheY-like chemotaxis protein
MVVVVATPNVAVGLAITRAVSAVGHQVTLERDPASVVATTSREEADVLVLDAALSEPVWMGVMHLVRTSATYRFSILVGTGGSREAVTALDAGADDYVRFPFDANEFNARLKMAERLLRYIRTSSLHIADGPAVVSSLPAWANLEESLTEALGRLLCAACQRVDGVPATDHRTAKLKLSLTRPQASVTLYLQADDAALSSITGLLLGTPNPEDAALNDVIKEVLNTLGGVFKRNALPVVEFTTGLPELVSNGAGSPPSGNSTLTKQWNIGWSKHSVMVRAVLRSEDVETVNVEQLAEGMVLAEDLHNPLGVLLAPRGMHLTASTIKRLSGVLGLRSKVRVANAN